jgi:predicted phage tail protein
LKERRRNELEQLLSVFDQNNRTSDVHILNVSEEDFIEKFRPIIRRLKGAASNSAVKKKMKEEDEILKYLRDCARIEASKVLKEKDKMIAKKDKSLAEKDKSLAEKDKSLAEKDNALEENKKSLAEKDKTIAEKNKEIAELKRLYRVK